MQAAITYLFVPIFISIILVAVRLVNGDTEGEGRVEIYNDGEWGTICDDLFEAVDAQTVCRMLGYGGGEALVDNEFGEGSGPIWLDSVQCTGYEAEVGLCDHSDWGTHDCGHHEDVGVRCGTVVLTHWGRD